MTCDFNKPSGSSATANFMAEIQANDQALAKQDYTGGANIPTGAIRFNTTIHKRETWNGSAWSALDVTGEAVASAAACTGNAATATSAAACTGNSTTASKLDNSGNGEYAADSGSANAYAVTLSPVPAAYFTGMRVQFKAANANTTASTINVNSLGAKTIKKSVSSDLVAGDIPNGGIVVLVYDGTYFQLINVQGLSPSFSAYCNTGQTGLTSGSTYKVQIDTEIFDTNANFDNSVNYRFTPSIPGKYLIIGAVAGSASTQISNVTAAIGKNGTIVNKAISAPYTTLAAQALVTCIIDFNGTTDYVELFGSVVGTGTLGIMATNTGSYFMGMKL